MTDPIERARPFFQQCGVCDAGLPMSCTCPTEDYRPIMAALVEEVERLRNIIAEPSIPVRSCPGADDETRSTHLFIGGGRTFRCPGHNPKENRK